MTTVPREVNILFSRAGMFVECPLCRSLRRVAAVISKENGVWSCYCGAVAFMSADNKRLVAVQRIVKFSDKSKRTVVWDMDLSPPRVDFSGLLQPFGDGSEAVPEGMVACGDSAIFFTCDGLARDTPHGSLWISKVPA